MARFSLFFLVTCLLVLHPTEASYDLGSGTELNEECSAYEHAYCTPSLLEVTLGVVGSLGLIAGFIAIANSGSGSNDDVPTTLPSGTTAGVASHSSHS